MRLAAGAGRARLALAFTLALAHMQATRAQEALLGGAFKVCSRSDPQLKQCILDSLNGARDKLATGIPELGLPSLEPLRGSEILVHEGEQDFNLQLAWRNYSWSGLSDFVTTKARIQFSPPYIEFVTTFKNITLAGPYEFGGSILTFRINGNGDSYLNWGSNVTHRLRLEEEERNGEVYWRVNEFSWQQDIFHLHSHFKNLF
ncbi:hypothetical protein R5R35_004091 [Gryllus longicercus]|uniref:Accessory gland protein n=1 Tax=Gryllus longicercus TaxID=2509291 RepID=A0AAN9VJY6_9ORTH